MPTATETVSALADLGRSYIADTVEAMLADTPRAVRHLRAIIDACTHLPDVTLATLNHDLVLEVALEGHGVDYADGFEAVDNELRIWRDEWDQEPVRLLKLHGSIDWWSFEFAEQLGRGATIARFSGRDPWHPEDESVDRPAQPRPHVLTGTFDKILAYETSIFPAQHFRFYEAMRDATTVVVIGYGFGDKAINTRLIAWAARNRRHRIILCDPDPTRLIETRARNAIRRAAGRWIPGGQLAIVQATAGDLDYASIEHFIAS
jgi:hypothetical protein